jgi:hypothetical protein
LKLAVTLAGGYSIYIQILYDVSELGKMPPADTEVNAAFVIVQTTSNARSVCDNNLISYQSS